MDSIGIMVMLIGEISRLSLNKDSSISNTNNPLIRNYLVFHFFKLVLFSQD